MRLYWEVFRHGYRRWATYRAATAAGVFTNSVFGFLRAYVLVAVFAASATMISTTLPGKIASVQGYRATICSVDRVLLRRVLEGTRSDLAARIEGCRAGLEAALVDAIRELHWKDFETLVDLVFRAAGWVRWRQLTPTAGWSGRPKRASSQPGGGGAPVSRR